MCKALGKKQSYKEWRESKQERKLKQIRKESKQDN